MKKHSPKFSRFIVLTILTVFAADISAQMTSFQAVEKMTCGINVGRCLELDAGESSRTIKEYYFTDFKTAGFDFVRIPIQWNAHTGTTAPYTIDAAWLNRVEQVIDWSLSKGLITIINSHHDVWILENNSYTATDLERFKAIWTQVSERFKNKSENLIFEIANEPNIAVSKVDQINAAIIPIIRATNSTRNIVFGSAGTQMSTLKQAAIPNDPYLIASYHSYIPWSFAGNGVGTWGTTVQMDSVRNIVMGEAAAWGEANNIPMLLGEFAARSSCDATSRVKWFASHMEEARKRNIAPCVWQDFGNFSIYYDSGTAGSWSSSVKTAVVAKYHEPPMALSLTNNLLTWKNNDTDYQSLKIQRKVGVGTYQDIATIAGNAESYTDVTTVTGTSYIYRVVATFSTGEIGYSFPSSVYRAPVITTSIPGRIEAENYSNMFGVVKTSTNIGMIAPGDWVEYRINVPITRTYKLDFNVSTIYSTAAANISIDGGASIATFIAPNTADWNTFNNKSIDLSLPAGIHTLRIDFTVLAFKTDYINITESSTGIDEIKIPEKKVTVYPNPVSGSLNIQNIDQNSTIKIFNLTGELLLEKKLDNKGCVLAVNDLSSGLYVLKAFGESGTSMIKFQKK